MNKRIIRIIILLYVMLPCWLICAGSALSQTIPAKMTIVLDPAHGGEDPGVKISDKVNEKDLTLKIAMLLKKELSKSVNLQIVLTRDKDVDVSVQDRKKIISIGQNRMMVSLHVNGGFKKTAKGFEIYFPGFKDVKTAKQDSSAIISDMTKNKYLNESVRLAQNLQKNLEVVFPKEYRGLRVAPLQLLDGLSIPAVVVEIGFAGNVENGKKLRDEKYQQDIAKALSKGIRESL